MTSGPESNRRTTTRGSWQRCPCRSSERSPATVHLPSSPTSPMTRCAGSGVTRHLTRPGKSSRSPISMTSRTSSLRSSALPPSSLSGRTVTMKTTVEQSAARNFQPGSTSRRSRSLPGGERLRATRFSTGTADQSACPTNHPLEAPSSLTTDTWKGSKPDGPSSFLPLPSRGKRQS